MLATSSVSPFAAENDQYCLVRTQPSIEPKTNEERWEDLLANLVDEVRAGKHALRPHTLAEALRQLRI